MQKLRLWKTRLYGGPTAGQRGAAVVEYAFVLVLISVVAVASVQYLGGSVAGEYDTAATALNGQDESNDSTTTTTIPDTTTTIPDTTTTTAPTTTTIAPTTTTTAPTTTTIPPTTTTLAPTTTTVPPTTTTLPCVPRGQSHNCK